MNYIAGAGGSVALAGQPVGRGGEGQVMPVAGSQALVAKIFHQPTTERWWKLAFILANPMPPTQGHCPVAWPIDLLFTYEAKPQFTGYLMPRIDAAHPVFAYYTQDLRLARCPGFDYRHMVRAGRNLAGAVALAHSRRYVIGDVNESDVLLREDSLVSLIDVDSWQVVDSARGVTYRCPVGKGDFTPPELQGRNLANVDRHPCHDHFALAVLLCKLVSEGSHPFDGVYHGSGDPPPLEARIASGALPWRDHSGLWTPKPGAVPFTSLHSRLQQLFVRAFEDGHREPRLRPDAVAWQDAFRRAEAALVQCPRNRQHWSWGTPCTWCERASLLGGRDPFPAVWARPAKPRSGAVRTHGRRASGRPQPALAQPAPVTCRAATPAGTPAPGSSRLTQWANDIERVCGQVVAGWAKHPFRALAAAAGFILVGEIVLFLITRVVAP